MTATTSTTAQYFIGWDVGGWNCDKNARSRDAIVILDQDNQIVGEPWGWKNLRTQINGSVSSAEWIQTLFSLCSVDIPKHPFHVTLAIDTPLGFSDQFRSLINALEAVPAEIESSDTNPYLFRKTELFLFEHGMTPLSAIKDMIGSQATKGMHVLSRFAPITERCGVWTDGDCLTVVEAYPAACKGSATIRGLRQHPALGREDIEDALTCALVALLFGLDRSKLVGPPKGTSVKEGWIWVPSDAMPKEPQQ